MFPSKKFAVLFLASLIGFTLGFRFTQTTLAAKPPVVQHRLALVQPQSAPISRRTEGNSS